MRDLTGREPEGFTTIARRYTSRLDTRRTPGNLARTMWDMTLIGLIPPPMLNRFVRHQQHPEPAQPTLSINSQHWQSNHQPAPTQAPTIGRTAASPRQQRQVRADGIAPVP